MVHVPASEQQDTGFQILHNEDPSYVFDYFDHSIWFKQHKFYFYIWYLYFDPRKLIYVLLDLLAKFFHLSEGNSLIIGSFDFKCNRYFIFNKYVLNNEYVKELMSEWIGYMFHNGIRFYLCCSQYFTSLFVNIIMLN